MASNPPHSLIAALRAVRTFNASRERLRDHVAAFAHRLAPGSLLLDAGAGDAPYRSLFAHTRYESADFGKIAKAYAPSTFVCDLGHIPVPAGRYDAVLFTQVIEHLPEPKQVLAELYRVLRPGGLLCFSGPLYFTEHEVPYDFFRYTQYGLRHLFADVGFVIDEFDWLEGYFGTLAYQVGLASEQLPVTPRALGGDPGSYVLAPVLLGVRAACVPLAFLLHQLELRRKITSHGHPKNYIAVLRKP